jgi:hypothetical protein
VARRNDQAPRRPLQLADWQMGMGRAADILRMNPAGDSAAKLLTRDEARRIAANIAKLPEASAEVTTRAPPNTSWVLSLSRFRSVSLRILRICRCAVPGAIQHSQLC